MVPSLRRKMDIELWGRSDERAHGRGGPCLLPLKGCISLYLPDSVWIGRCHPFTQRYMEGRCNYMGILSQDSKIQGRITSRYGLSWHQQSFHPWEPALEALGARIPDVDRAFYIWIIPDIDLYWWDCWYEVEGKVRCGAVGVSRFPNMEGSYTPLNAKNSGPGHSLNWT